MDYISDQLNWIPLSSLSNFHILSAQTILLMLKHNVPSYLTHTFTNRLFLFNLAKKHDSFHKVNKKWRKIFESA